MDKTKYSMSGLLLENNQLISTAKSVVLGGRMHRDKGNNVARSNLEGKLHLNQVMLFKVHESSETQKHLVDVSKNCNKQFKSKLFFAICKK